MIDRPHPIRDQIARHAAISEYQRVADRVAYSGTTDRAQLDRVTLLYRAADAERHDPEPQERPEWM